MHMLHHISFGVTDLGVMATFYDAVLEPLGFVRVWDSDWSVGYGIPGGGDKFALKRVEGARTPGAGFHLAFSAPSHDAIHRFHEAAMKHGGIDNGAPGMRPDYGPHYCAAFVVDPEGHRIEAVLNAPQQP